MLAGASLVYIGYGAGLVFMEPAEGKLVALRDLFMIAPPLVWGVLFALVGFFALLSTRWPRGHANWGYVVMCGWAAFWAGAYGIPLLFFGAQWDLSIPGALVWSMIAYLWWGISGLISPEMIREKPPERGL